MATIHQGDLYWVKLDEAGYSHPYLVVQDDLLNRSRIHTVVLCALTSNLKQVSAPGNVLLDAGEGSLPRLSVVVVSKVTSLEKDQLGEYIGSLSLERMAQVLAGMKFLQLSTNRREAEDPSG